MLKISARALLPYSSTSASSRVFGVPLFIVVYMLVFRLSDGQLARGQRRMIAHVFEGFFFYVNGLVISSGPYLERIPLLAVSGFTLSVGGAIMLLHSLHLYSNLDDSQQKVFHRSIWEFTEVLFPPVVALFSILLSHGMFGLL